MPKDIDINSEPLPRREFDSALAAHLREHDIHEKAHIMEHKMSEDALNKADLALERRLEGMNEFRAQLEKQAGAFLTREIFDDYSKEQINKVETALVASTDKYDTIIKAIVSRHDSDTDVLQVEIQNLKESLQTEIRNTKDALQTEVQGEREYRKTFEGSINTWKWLATFLGASGLAGVIYMFATSPH